MNILECTRFDRDASFGALPCFDSTQILETVNSGQFIGYMTFPPLHLTYSRIYALRIDEARMLANAEKTILLLFCCVAVRFVKDINGPPSTAKQRGTRCSGSSTGCYQTCCCSERTSWFSQIAVHQNTPSLGQHQIGVFVVEPQEVHSECHKRDFEQTRAH